MRKSIFTLLFITLVGASSLQASTPAETRVKVTKSKLICDHDAIDIKGYSMCKASLRFDIMTDDEHAESADVTCEALFDYKSKKFPDGTSEQRYASKNIDIDDKSGSGKIYVTWRNLADAATDMKIAKSSCRIEKLYTARPDPIIDTPEPEPAPVKAPAAVLEQPAQKPQPQVQPLPATDTPKTAVSPQMELELLKEKNRAKELEIKALELKIKLREMEK